MKYVLVVVLAACGGGSSTPPPIDSGGPGPITCDMTGSMAFGQLTDGANVMHTFGPQLQVTWYPAQTNAPGSISVDDGTTRIDIFGIDAGPYPAQGAPPRGTYTDTSFVNLFTATWGSPETTPESLDVTIDAAPTGDPCWAGRFHIRYSFDKGPVEGEIFGEWTNH